MIDDLEFRIPLIAILLLRGNEEGTHVGHQWPVPLGPQSALFVLFRIVTGVTLLMANWYPAVAGAAVLTLVVIRTRKEEERLIERFGDEYREYLQQVGHFLPRLRQQP